MESCCSDDTISPTTTTTTAISISYCTIDAIAPPCNTTIVSCPILSTKIVTTSIIKSSTSVMTCDAETSVSTKKPAPSTSHLVTYTIDQYSSFSTSGTSVPLRPVQCNSGFIISGVLGGLLLLSVIFNIALTIYVFIKWKTNSRHSSNIPYDALLKFSFAEIECLLIKKAITSKLLNQCCLTITNIFTLYHQSA